MAATQQWMYVFGPGDRPELRTEPGAWTDADNAIGSAHYQRLKDGAVDGTVILAGLSTDPSGPSVVIFEADSLEEATTFMNSDPFVAEGLFTATLYPFVASLVRGEV